MDSPQVRVDPITLELVNEGLVAIVREMRANMIRTAYSSIIYEGQDFSCCIVDAQGQLVAKAPADHPSHILPIPWSVRAVMDRYAGQLQAEDVYLHNDPYEGGTHLNDVATIFPVFVDGRLMAFTVVRAHWADVGGMTPGSISGQVTEIYQEGVRLPPIQVYERGRPEAVLDLIFANVRGPAQRKGDFNATVVSVRQAARKLGALASKYGSEVLRASMGLLIERQAARLRERIDAVPDGSYSYEAYAESNGRTLEPLLVRLTLSVQGGELTADFSGSSPQTQGPLNMGPSMAAAAVLNIAKSYLDPTPEVNHGSFRPLRVIAPEGTVINARLPAPCGGVSEIRRAADTAVMGALAAAVPELATGDNKGGANHVYIGGRDAEGRLLIFYEYPAGGTAAYCGGDGATAMRNFQEGDFASIQPIEAIEHDYPFLVERCEVRRDSAGAGRWRGGFGLQREVRVLADHLVLSVLTDRTLLRPHGVCGAEAGAGNCFTVRREGREIEPSDIPGKASGFPLRRDDVIVMRSAGGGGYGDPLDRPPESVLRDVREGYLSADAARRQYGVVLASGAVDEGATSRLREMLRAGRVQVTLAPGSGPEMRGARRILPIARSAAERAGVGAGDVVELVNPRGAPLRAWAEVVDEDGDNAYLGPIGLGILGAAVGARLWLRFLSTWGPLA